MQTSKTVQLGQKLVNSKKVYRPAANTAQGNVASWELVQKALKKGPQTRLQLEALLTKERNHKPFIGYAIRRGWLIAK